MVAKVSAIVLGAGRNSEGGDLPPGLLSLDGHYSVLHWVNDALREHAKSPINFVGGYRIKDIAHQHPQFSYILNPEWENSGVLESLYQARVRMTEQFLVSYSDIVYRGNVVSALLENQTDDIVIATSQLGADLQGDKNRVCVTSDNRVTNIGFLSSSREVNAQFTGLVLFQNAGARLAQQFFEHHYPKQRNQAFEQAQKLKDGYLTDFIRYAIGRGLSVRAVDASGDWSEINAVFSLAKFVLGTKGETLNRIAPLLEKSAVPPLVYFTLREWQQDKGGVINQIQARFSGHPLVIRSSTQKEDSWRHSNAGAFCSVLGVNVDEAADIARAIEQVIASYSLARHSEIQAASVDDGEWHNEQFVVQVMVQEVQLSGVVFTNTLETGAPYYVINYQEGSDTDGITSGSADNQHLLHIRKSVSTNHLNSVHRAIVEAVKEIELRLNHSALDIEFALDKTGTVHVLQVRPLTIGFITQEKLQHHKNISESARSFLTNEQSRHKTGILGRRQILSNMADWNPAEMIGAVSSPLAASLYDYLITRNIWADARARLGYRDMTGCNLMTLLASRPYIDLRLVFNSYLPDTLSPGIGEKLINAWLEQVSESPKLHDKVEFDVAYTCWYFGFKDKFETLHNAGFTGLELQSIEEVYQQHTCETLKTFPDLARELQSEVEKLESWRASTQGYYRGNAALQRALTLLDKCRQSGTYSFAIYARWAFIATTLLRSLVNTGKLSESRATALEHSVQTVAGAFLEAQRALQQKIISQQDFMAEYGHLRPGAYDICAFRYDERPDLFTGIVQSQQAPNTDSEKKVAFRFNDAEQALLEPLFRDLLGISLMEFEQFFRFAVEQREYGKFMFTKVLSEALENLKVWAADKGLSAQEAQLLTINQMADMAYVSEDINASRLRELVTSAQQLCALDKALVFPDLMSKPEDVDVVQQSLATPNFVSEQIVTGQLVECSNAGNMVDLEGKIVLIVSADPGFDWIFTRNIKGLITQYGGAASHMTIRAAEFGLPAAIGCGQGIYEKLKNCNSVTLDCKARTVVGH